MKKITFLQLTAAIIMLAFGLMLAAPFVQTTDADLDDALCAAAEVAVFLAFQSVQEHCFDNWDPDKCDKAWEALGLAVAFRDLVCNGDDDDDDDDEESSS